MAIKNLFGRGIGFNAGLVKWVVTRGYDIGASGTLPNAILGSVILQCQNSGNIITEANELGQIVLEPSQLAGIIIEP